MSTATAQPPETGPKPQPKPVTASETVSTEMPSVTGGSPVAQPPASGPPGTAPEPETALIMHNGRGYDPKKYRLNPDGTLWLGKNGRPMPRGGRKPRQTAVPPVSAQPQTAPQPSFIPPAPENGNGEPTGTETGNGAEPSGEMPAASAKAVAEVATNAGYALTGALIGDAKAARPSPAEHANLRDTAAAYIEARGLRFVGGAAILVGVAAYLLGEDRRAAIWEALKALAKKIRKPLKDVIPVSGPAANAGPQPTAPAPSAFDYAIGT